MVSNAKYTKGDMTGHATTNPTPGDGNYTVTYTTTQDGLWCAARTADYHHGGWHYAYPDFHLTITSGGTSVKYENVSYGTLIEVQCDSLIVYDDGTGDPQWTGVGLRTP